MYKENANAKSMTYHANRERPTIEQLAIRYAEWLEANPQATAYVFTFTNVHQAAARAEAILTNYARIDIARLKYIDPEEYLKCE